MQFIQNAFRDHPVAMPIMTGLLALLAIMSIVDLCFGAMP